MKCKSEHLISDQTCKIPDKQDSHAWPEGNCSVWSAGRVVGNVTSATFSPSLNNGKALYKYWYVFL